MDDSKKEAVEGIIANYLSNYWKEKDINFYLKSNNQVLDLKIVNDSLRKPISDFVLRGGKRLRPVLFLTILNFFKIKTKDYLDFAYFIEIIHNGTLVLDDIEDKALLRRGKTTCHRKFGLDVAVNAGVSMHFLPLRLMTHKKELTYPQRCRILDIYADELINVCFGQAIDIYWHNYPEKKITINQYLEMVRLKTGSLMRMSARIACVLASQSEEIEGEFKNFAEKIGMGFQIVDDCLDLQPDNQKFGKTYGNDITEGKISMPVLFAFDFLDKKKAERLRSILSLHTRNKKLINEARDIITGTGALTKSLDYAYILVDTAWNKLEKEFKNKGDLNKLKQLCYSFVKRDY